MDCSVPLLPQKQFDSSYENKQEDKIVLKRSVSAVPTAEIILIITE